MFHIYNYRMIWIKFYTIRGSVHYVYFILIPMQNFELYGYLEVVPTRLARFDFCNKLPEQVSNGVLL